MRGAVRIENAIKLKKYKIMYQMTEKGNNLGKNVLYTKKITKKSEKIHCVINVEKMRDKLL